MDEYPIKVGSMLYTLVDPNKGHEVAYNRWYERDHFYGGCMVGPWLFAGSRWVATRDLKDLRFPHGDANLLTRPDDAGSYVAIYWVHEGRHAEHFAWAGNQVVELYKDGRGFNERTHAHTVLYHYGETVYRDPDGVPIELALDHKYEGSVTVAVKRAEGVSAEELAQWVRTEGMPPLLADGPVAMGSVWAPELGGTTRLRHRWIWVPPPGARTGRCNCSSPSPTRPSAGIASSTMPDASTTADWPRWSAPRPSSAPSSAPTPTPTSSGEPVLPPVFQLTAAITGAKESTASALKPM